MLLIFGLTIGAIAVWNSADRIDRSAGLAGDAPRSDFDASSVGSSTKSDLDEASFALLDARGKFVRLMNLAKSYLEVGDHERALERLGSALALDRSCAATHRNIARAHLFSDKPASALAPLEAATRYDPDSPATAYLTGVALARLARFAEALPHLERAAQLSPSIAAVRFQLAAAYEALDMPEKAAAQYRQAVSLDARHTAAHYKLAMLARAAENQDEYRRNLREFTRLRELFGAPANSPMEHAVCRLTEAEPAPPSLAGGPSMGLPTDIPVRFTDASQDVFPQAEDRVAAVATVIGLDDDGRYTLFVATREGRTHLLTLRGSGTFERTDLALDVGKIGSSPSCFVGNFHDSLIEDLPEETALPDEQEAGAQPALYSDVLLASESGTHLYERQAAGAFRDVTDLAGIGTAGARAAIGVDYEYDGDLDIVLARASGLELWQNNGDGSFREVAEDVGLGKRLECIDIAAIDVDGNDAVDLIAARGVESTVVYENRRAGKLEPMPQPPGPWPAAEALLSDDLDNDGAPDVVLFGEMSAVVIPGRGSQRQRIDLGDLRVESAVLIDYDNDGWLDVCAAGRSRRQGDEGLVKLWRNGGDSTWNDVSKECALDVPRAAPLVDVLAADFDADGDTDLLLVTSRDQLEFLRNDGGNIYGQLKLRLVSLIIGNRGGVGTQIEVRDGERAISRWTQVEAPIEIGLGDRTRVDAVRAVFSDGIVRSRVNVDVRAGPLEFVVTEYVTTGSCPYLYVWDGRGFRFVTDLLGAGALGVPVSRDRVEPANPVETVLIGDAHGFQPRDGDYEVRVTNELRETDYLDSFQLLAVDHEKGVEIHSTDALIAPPFPESRLVAICRLTPPRSARGDDGIDRTAHLRTLDGVFAPPGPILPPPLRGVCRVMTLTLDFGSFDASRPLVLALTGWTQYGTSSSNIALSQNSAVEVLRPRLVAETADGNLRQIDVAVGLPAGKTKTVLCDLEGKLPRDTVRLNLTTSFEIRWDRIALGEKAPGAIQGVHELSLRSADLSWRGFSEIRQRREGHPPTPDFLEVVPRPRWYTALAGWHTAYGDVLELLDAQDGKLVLLNGGDALTLRFAIEGLALVTEGGARTFALRSVGWNKEGDTNTVTGDTVEPLPGDPETPGDSPGTTGADWRLRYNTRYISRDHFAPRRR